MKTQSTALSCRCGEVTLKVQGKPIISAECLCTDCQAAGAVLQALPDAPSIVDENGATRFVLYRKDRVHCTRGQSHLREHRLSEGAPTRRVVAVCCNTPMFLEFSQGHWLSLYGGLWTDANIPPLEIRTMTRSRRAGVELPDDVPNPKTHTLSFYGKLFGAWVAMGFRTPKVDYVAGPLEASNSEVR
ncbi:GFA family protein [Saccharospirillum alexandrii]|uniref:GFA family protein n=1 Tax=Saccharospirillum alexandrii TaxID=2448477 RepID=UPI000FDC33BC|nr:DUF6151 family protein [Saccharospirillum alexandrii]